MNITLNSSEAQTLYNTGRLIRTVDCDWQPPRQAIEIRDDTVYVMLSTGPVWSKKLTPPLEVGAVYDVKEPWRYTQLNFGPAPSKAIIRRETEYQADYLGAEIEGETWSSAEEMPDYLVRQQATPTYKLVFEEGKLRWYEELKRV